MLLCVGAVTSCSEGGSPDRESATSTTGAVATTHRPSSDVSDLRRFADRIVDEHPDPFHHVSQADFDAAAAVEPGDGDELFVAAVACR